MKIGITERGDAGIDFSWVDKLLDMNIIISKNLNQTLIKHLIENKDKVIFHMTCTGFGNSIIEPNVPSLDETYSQVLKLIKEGFPVEQIVLRVDPIIPTSEGIRRAQNVLWMFQKTGIKRVRYSFIDLYPHVRERFERAGIQVPFEGFSCSKEMADKVLSMLGLYSHIYEYEACAENTPHQLGCISQKDFNILKVKFTPEVGGFQRKGCMCAAGKTELLNSKKRCPHKCLYCYWRD